MYTILLTRQVSLSLPTQVSPRFYIIIKIALCVCVLLLTNKTNACTNFGILLKVLSLKTSNSKVIFHWTPTWDGNIYNCLLTFNFWESKCHFVFWKKHSLKTKRNLFWHFAWCWYKDTINVAIVSLKRNGTPSSSYSSGKLWTTINIKSSKNVYHDPYIFQNDKTESVL